MKTNFNNPAQLDTFCEFCRFYRPFPNDRDEAKDLKNGTYLVGAAGADTYGTCQRYAPRPDLFSGPQVEDDGSISNFPSSEWARWPQVAEDDFCGDYASGAK